MPAGVLEYGFGKVEINSDKGNPAGHSFRTIDCASERLLLVFTTSDDRAVLESIGAPLVEIDLAGCCQISGPLTSVYRWQGKLERAQEFEYRIKTTAARFEQIEAEITRPHNYDLPQIVGFPIVACSREYRNWLWVWATEDRLGACRLSLPRKYALVLG